jgi:hypothetical protein
VPSLSIILQVLIVSLFQQETLPQLFTQYTGIDLGNDPLNQLMLNGICPDASGVTYIIDDQWFAKYQETMSESLLRLSRL